MKFRRASWIAITAAVVLTVSLSQPEAQINHALERLDPSTRLEQICSLEAMNRVDHDKNPYHPDRAVMYAVSQPRLNGNLLSGDGGAFRSRGKWYQFSYVCRTTPDHMQVTEFSYKLGAKIPEDKWSEYGLW